MEPKEQLLGFTEQLAQPNPNQEIIMRLDRLREIGKQIAGLTDMSKNLRKEVMELLEKNHSDPNYKNQQGHFEFLVTDDLLYQISPSLDGKDINVTYRPISRIKP